MNLLRRRQRRLTIERAVLGRQRPTTVPEPQVHPELWRALRELPQRQREAVALRYVADLTEADVAVAMGVATGTASATLATARRALADVLGNVVWEDSHGAA